ncbi:hypothetical protein CR513_01447, partial [Mucuna pruriens]
MEEHETIDLMNGGHRKEKSIAQKVQKAPKGSSFEAFKTEESSYEVSKEEGLDEDEISFISKNIHSMWKKKGKSK